MKKVIIKCFKTLKHHYFYDRYTNSIVKVSPEEYEVLSQIEKTGVIEDKNAVIEKFIECGLLHEKAAVEIRHPSSDDIEYLAENKVQELILQVTQQCNLRCSYCTYSGNYCNREHSSNKMSFDIAKRAIDFYIEHSAEKAILIIAFYGGEPLLEFPLIRQCVEYVKKRISDKDIHFYITTNGTLLEKEIVSFLCEHNFHITISLDGYKEAHDSNRKFVNGKGSFDLIMKNLQEIKNYDRSFFETIRYNTVVSPKADWYKVFTFYSESKMIDPKHVKVTPVSDFCLENKKIIETKASFWIPYRYEYLKFLLYMVGKIEIGDIQPVYEKGMYDTKILYKTLQRHNVEQPMMHHGGPCIPGVQRLFINTEGDFYPCERVSEIIPNMNIGTLNKGYDYEKMKALLNIGLLTREKCLDCWNLRLCKICAGQIEPIEKKLTFDGKRARCIKSERESLCSLRELCILNENGFKIIEEGEYEE